MRDAVLDGFHAVKHAMRFGAEVGPVLTVDRDAVLALVRSHAPDLAERFAAELVQAPAAALTELTGLQVHPTGVAGLARRPPQRDVRDLIGAAPVVVLDQPRHAGNVGAAVRVAAGLGAAAVVTTGTLDPWHPVVLRGSAGLHFALPVQRVSPQEIAGRCVLAFDAGGEDLRRAEIPDDALLVFGSERHGVGPALRERADRVIALPMRPLVSSYNLATSVAMALYHWSLYHRTTGSG